MKVTAQWIAEQCGVSRGTVDRVVNGRPNVAPEVRERVQKIISEYGYKTPSQRQAARAGHGAFRIGVILPSWDAFFIRRMREGIRVAVHNRGCAAEPPPVSYRTEHGQIRPDCRRTACTVR